MDRENEVRTSPGARLVSLNRGRRTRFRSSGLRFRRASPRASTVMVHKTSRSCAIISNVTKIRGEDRENKDIRFAAKKKVE